MASIATDQTKVRRSVLTQAKAYLAKNTLGLRSDVDALTRVHWAAIGIAGITGTVHLYLYWTQSFIPFLLAGLGFLTMAALVPTTFDHRLLYLGGIPFTAMQIIAWVQLGMPDFQLGVADKTLQVVLICLLGYLYVSEHRSADIDTVETPEAKGAVR